MRNFSLAVVAFFLAAISNALGQLVFLDDLSHFPAGTILADNTNYVPGVWSPWTTANIYTDSTGVATISVSNLLGSVRLFFNTPANPGGENPDYQVRLDNLTLPTDDHRSAYVTNRVVDVRWLSWIENTSSLTRTGGLAVGIATTSLDIWDNGTTNLLMNPLVFFADNGNAYAFTNTPNQTGGLQPIVRIGSWGSLKGTIMTNRLVLNYPVRTFSLSVNGTVLTNNMAITAYFTNVFSGVDFGAAEMLPSSVGNKFALNDVQIVVTNAGKDVHSFIVAAKGQKFEQTGTNAPSPSATNWFFHSELEAVQTNSVWWAKVHFPGGGKTNLVQDSDSSYWSFDDPFASQTALDTAYSNGLHRLNILGVNQGTYQSSLNLTNNSYPNTPQIANYDAAQAIDAGQGFTLQWNSSGGGASDWVMLEVDDTLSNVVIVTPDFTQTNVLTGAVTSYLIPAGTLQPDNTYQGKLVFARPVAVDSNSVAGARGATAYFKQTEFTLATLPPPGPSCVLTPALATNDVGTVHAVTATVTTNSVPVAGVTVHFLVVSGPQSGTNAAPVTSGSGQAAFSYTGTTNGTDTIRATGVINGLAFTGTAVKVWLAPNVLPVVICQDVIVQAVSNCQAGVSAAAVDDGSYDPDGTIVSRVLTPPGPYSLGTNNVTLTVTDNRGGSNSCSATITVIDQTPPTITCSSNLVIVASFGQTNAVVDFSAPIVSDNCSVQSAGCVPASGSTFPLGTNTVTCTAIDGSSNTNTCSFHVVVTAAPAQADLALTAASNVATASLNNAFSYTLTVTNKGPQDAAGARLVDSLPANVTYSNAVSSVGSCTNVGGVITCAFGTLANGATATVSVVVTPNDPAVASACSAVTVTNSLLDPVASNNSTTICTSVVIDNLAVTAFKAAKRVVLSAKRTNVVSKLSVTIQNRSLHSEVIPNIEVLSNLVSVSLSPIGTNACATPVPQLVPPKSFPIALASGKSVKLAYTVNFTCATDPLRTATKTGSHDDYQYLVTVDHEALDGLADSRSADDVCPHNALGADPYNAKIKDKGCGLKNKDGTFGPIVTDIVDTRMP